MPSRTVVRALLATDRRASTERELEQFSIATNAGRPYRQGSLSDLLWDFTGPHQLADAQTFIANIEHTPGVVGIVGPDRRQD
jgi:hypothetical protein